MFGTPGNICTFPFTTEMGTQLSSSTKIACFARSRDSSVGSSTMRMRDFRDDVSTSQLKSGSALCLLNRFMSWKASACTFSGKPKAFAIDGYVISSCLFYLTP